MIGALDIMLAGSPQNYSLLTISESSRIQAISALTEQLQRISMSAPIRSPLFDSSADADGISSLSSLFLPHYGGVGGTTEQICSRDIGSLPRDATRFRAQEMLRRRVWSAVLASHPPSFLRAPLPPFEVTMTVKSSSVQHTIPLTPKPAQTKIKTTSYPFRSACSCGPCK